MTTQTSTTVYSTTMPAEYISAIALPTSDDGNCLAVVGVGGIGPEYFRIQPLDKAVAQSLPNGALVGLLSKSNTIWCRKAEQSSNPFELQLTAVPAGEVITANVRIFVPQSVVDGHRLRQVLQQVAVEGPSDKLPTQFVVTPDEICERRSVTVGDLRMPMDCEPFGVPLDQEVMSVPKVAERSQSASTMELVHR